VHHARARRPFRAADDRKQPEDRGRKREAPDEQRERAAVLDRDLSGSFGSKAYAKEELVAEITGAFVCAALSIQPTVRQQFVHGAKPGDVTDLRQPGDHAYHADPLRALAVRSRGPSWRRHGR